MNYYKFPLILCVRKLLSFLPLSEGWFSNFFWGGLYNLWIQCLIWLIEEDCCATMNLTFRSREYDSYNYNEPQTYSLFGACSWNFNSWLICKIEGNGFKDLLYYYLNFEWALINLVIQGREAWRAPRLKIWWSQKLMLKSR